MSRKPEPIVPRIRPVAPRPGGTPYDRTAPGHTFAELLAQAEAVHDWVELRQAPEPPGLAGRVQGAVQGTLRVLVRQVPWMGLWALEKKPSSGVGLGERHPTHDKG